MQMVIQWLGKDGEPNNQGNRFKKGTAHNLSPYQHANICPNSPMKLSSSLNKTLGLSKSSGNLIQMKQYGHYNMHIDVRE